MIYKRKKVDGHILEIVGGIDIQHTYNDNSYVKSCMSKCPDALFYKYVKDLRLFRIKYKGNVHLRTLLWTGTTATGEIVKTLDEIYYCNCDYIGDCDCAQCTELAPGEPGCNVYDIFKLHFKEFTGAVRNTNKKITTYVKVPKTYKYAFPYFDSFDPDSSNPKTTTKLVNF